jgi:hypothetical protein
MDRFIRLENGKLDVSVVMPAGLHDVIADLAQCRGVTTEQQIVIAIREYLAHQKKQTLVSHVIG